MPVTITTEDDRKKPEPPKQPYDDKGYKRGGKAKKMASGGFNREPRMATTEPSVDEAKMKKGGSAKKMAMGGGMPVPPPMPMRGRAGMAGSRGALLSKPRVSMPMPPPQMPAPQMPAGPAMKKGGKMHRKAEGGDVAQDKALIKKAFKQHDTQEHKGGKGTSLKLKQGGKMATGGVIKPYKTGGVIESYKTGGVIKPYKDGGYAAMTCKDLGGFVSKKKLASC